MLIPLEGTFPGWPASPQPSVAYWLFVVIGIPVACMVVVGLLAGASSLARRGRGGSSISEPIWFGQTAGSLGAASRAALTAGAAAGEAGSPQRATGGASVRW